MKSIKNETDAMTAISWVGNFCSRKTTYQKFFFQNPILKPPTKYSRIFSKNRFKRT